MSKYKGKTKEGIEFIFETEDIKAYQKFEDKYYIGVLKESSVIGGCRLECDEELYNKIVNEKENK